ncbi:MAG: hypothetical protein HC830_03790, partial [Bacteroidetes bacterium]|nr:hypothetical protein [Bacteroidota bacterium]
DSITMEQKEKKAEGTITAAEEKIMLRMDFMTSRYNNLSDRFNADQVNVRALYDRGYMDFFLIAGTPGNEPLDIFENKGSETFGPLITFEADLSHTPWYTSDVYPRTYQHFPWYDYKNLLWRDTMQYGLKAQKAISIWQPAKYTSLGDQDDNIRPVHGDGNC